MSDSLTIHGPSLSAHFDRVIPELGATNARRLQQFIELTPTEDGSFSFSVVLDHLYSGQDKKKALESFKKFRQSINAAAEEVESSLRICDDQAGAGDLTRRFCWFEVDLHDNPAVEAFAKQSSIQGDRAKGHQSSRALVPGLLPEHLIFVSYAQKDKVTAKKLMEQLETRLAVQTRGKPYKARFWLDRMIETGDDWLSEILSALDRAPIGVFLLSVDFLNSSFIREEEIPVLIKKRTLPAMLKNFDLATYREPLEQIAEKQIYRYEHTNEKLYSWSQTRTDDIKSGYADELVTKIVRQLDAIDEQPERPHLDTFAKQAAEYDTKVDSEWIINNRGVCGSLDQLAPVDDAKPKGSEVVATDHLIEWAEKTSTTDNEFLAVLGEFGMGKTTTLHHFAQLLIERRTSDPSLPLPIVFDLRAYSPGDSEITLTAIIEACSKRISQPDGDPWSIDPEQLIRAVRTEAAIAIFDGLDEVMNGLSNQRRQEFIRELSSILPRLDEDDERPHGRGRIIMSCRSHFFRDVSQQNGIYMGNRRADRESNQFDMLLMLPFSEEQIRTYLCQCLGQETGEQVYQLLDQIHNLMDLASRPVLADMIREIAPQLESMQLDGRTIQGVDLYDRFVRQHLDRDSPKEIILQNHKLVMMEELAAALWLDGSREWPIEKLEDWLDQFLVDHPAISNRYQTVEPALLNQDLRNATSVVRRADAKSAFRFAHTSLQEYFLACWLFRRFAESADLAKLIEMALPSDETLLFLGQLLKADRRGTAMERIAKLIAKPNGRANLMIFRYWLVAAQHGYPQPSPTAVALAGESLHRWQISGITLPQADLSGAFLAETQWQNVTWLGGSLTGATLTKTQWRDCRMSQVNTTELITDGSIFRDCHIEEKERLGGWHIRNTASTPSAYLLKPQLTQIQQGHSRYLRRVIYDSDRGRYLTCAFDNTAKVWDANTWQCLATLSDHSDYVGSICYDSDRGRYLTGSKDNTVKVWNADTWQCLATLSEHKNSVWSISYDSARGRYLTGSFDNTAKVWDADTWQCLTTLIEHSSDVVSVSYDSDRDRYLTGSSDGSMKVWDANTWQCLTTINEQSNAIITISYNSIHSQYLTSYKDNTVKIWDADSWQHLATLGNHSGPVISISYDSDRDRYLTGSSDGSMKVWDVSNQQCLTTIGDNNSEIWSISYDFHRHRYLTGSNDGSLKLWNADTWQYLGSLSGQRNSLINISYDSNLGRYLTGHSDDAIKVWDADTWQYLGSLNDYSNSVRSITYDSDRGRYLTGSGSNSVKVWDAATLQCLVTLRGHSDSVRSISYDADRGRYLTSSFDHTMKVWDADTWQCLATLREHLGAIMSIIYDSDRGRYLTGSSDNTMKVWDAETWQCIATLKEDFGSIQSISYDSDRERYLTGTKDGAMKVWDANTWQYLSSTNEHSGPINSINYDSDRGRYLTSSSDGTMKVWDADTRLCLTTINCHYDEVYSVNYDSHRGRYLTASSDNTVKVWDADTWQCLITAFDLPDQQWAVTQANKTYPIAQSPRAYEHLAWIGREPDSQRTIAIPYGGLIESNPPNTKSGRIES